MTDAGSIYREENEVEVFTVKANEDIELGEWVANDGNGILAATPAIAVVGKPMIALEAHTYSTATTHTIRCGVKGVFGAQKVAGSGASKKGQKLMLSATDGEHTLFVKGAVSQTNTFATATDQAAIDKNAAVCGVAAEDCLDADTVQKVRI